MNGRIYDPRLGRFLQADPMVQAPKNAQNLNRYSYVLNNPLSYTDPSGYLFSSLWKKWLRPLASIAITAWMPVLLPYTGALAAATTGFAAGFVATGSLKGALIGAFTGAVFHGIGSHFDQFNGTGNWGDLGLSGGKFAAKTFAHGLAGGIQSSLNGGKFGHGFFSAGVTQAFSGRIGKLDSGNAGFSPQRVFAAASVGGTTSVLTGGKFANGAVTGAFSRALNDEIENFRRKKFEDALNYQVSRVISNRAFNLETRNTYSGSAIGSYIYSRDGYFTLEKYINPNQADINGGNPNPGLFGGDYQELPNNISALVIGDKPFTDVQAIIRNSGYFQRFSNSIGAPIFVIPHNRFVGDNIIRFDSKSCSYHPSGGSC